jgi:hypothetical protein
MEILKKVARIKVDDVCQTGAININDDDDYSTIYYMILN